MKNSNPTQEKSFFHQISPIILDFTQKASRKIAKVKEKTPHHVEFTTAADIEVEEIITKRIKSLFPGDQIIAEENSPNTSLAKKGRFWIIDPICGTTNFSRGSNLYATNIALAKDTELIAACVIDHNEGKYIWSTGNGSLFSGRNKIFPIHPEPPRVIEFEFPTVNSASRKKITKFTKFIDRILQDTNYYIASYATSLAFTYTALGKIDAYIVPKIRIWDVAAPNFLVLQSGGVISELSGKPWTLNSNNVLGARDKKLHKKLLNLLNHSK